MNGMLLWKGEYCAETKEGNGKVYLYKTWIDGTRNIGTGQRGWIVERKKRTKSAGCNEPLYFLLAIVKGEHCGLGKSPVESPRNFLMLE